MNALFLGPACSALEVPPLGPFSGSGAGAGAPRLAGWAGGGGGDRALELGAGGGSNNNSPNRQNDPQHPGQAPLLMSLTFASGGQARARA